MNGNWSEVLSNPNPEIFIKIFGNHIYKAMDVTTVQKNTK